MDYIAYYRLSKVKTQDLKDKKDDESMESFKQRFMTQGLKAQKFICKKAVRQAGGKIISEYKEIESGKKKRVRLEAAISEAIEKGAYLVVAKSDRLARDVYSALSLKRKMQEEGLQILFADNPRMSDMEFIFQCVFAEREWELASKRQKDVIEYSRKYGTKTGNWYGNPKLGSKEYNKYRREGNRANQDRAKLNPDNQRLFAFMKFAVEEAGAINMKHVSEMANSAGHTASKGGAVTGHTVKRLFKLFKYTPKYGTKRKRRSPEEVKRSSE